MALPPLNSFADVQNFFNDFITKNGIDIAGSPHGVFWNTYSDFVNGNVPNVFYPNSTTPVSILCKGNGKQSNIIYALAGTPGTPWDPNNPNAYFPRMPAPKGPYFSADQIQQLSDWITKGCPE